jgi:hypothetical protein
MLAHPPPLAQFPAKVQCLLEYTPMCSCPGKMQLKWLVYDICNVSVIPNSYKSSYTLGPDYRTYCCLYWSI